MAADDNHLVLDLTDEEMLALGYALGAGMQRAEVQGEREVLQWLQAVHLKVYAANDLDGAPSLERFQAARRPPSKP